MIQISKSALRSYLLDTNVLIHDPSAMLRFEEHEVLIPMTVLEELDKLKTGHSETAQAARQATRTLGNLIDRITLEDLEHGVELPGGGRLTFLREGAEQQENLGGCDLDVPDHRILANALTASRERPGRTLTVISKDINLRLKSAALGIPVEDYRFDSVFSDSDAMTEGVWTPAPGENIWDLLDFYDHKPGSEQEWGRTQVQVSGALVKAWHPRMLVLDGCGHAFEVLHQTGDSALLSSVRSYTNDRSVWGVQGRDPRQNYALHLLLDPEVDLVTIAGRAGTGKTFLAMAAALALVFDQRRFARVILSREAVSMGEDIGFLPGDEEEKMAPWVRGFQDAIRELTGAVGDQQLATQTFLEQRLEIRSIGLMRGRTFHDTLVILDEAQNLTPRQTKNLLTRCGHKTKILCLGNVAQIDTPYLTPSTCGLAHIVQRFRSCPHAGHVTLEKIERSRLAEAAEQRL